MGALSPLSVSLCPFGGVGELEQNTKKYIDESSSGGPVKAVFPAVFKNHFITKS